MSAALLSLLFVVIVVVVVSLVLAVVVVMVAMFVVVVGCLSSGHPFGDSTCLFYHELVMAHHPDVVLLSGN